MFENTKLQITEIKEKTIIFRDLENNIITFIIET